MSVVPTKRPKPPKQKEKPQWERLVELTEATNPDMDEINRLRSKLLNKSTDNDKLDWNYEKGRNSGQPVFAKMLNGNLLSFSTYTQVGDYFGVAASSISTRVYEGIITRSGKVKRISFYIEE